MADEKTFISQLNSADTANDTDIMIIEGEETKKISFLSLFNAIKTKLSLGAAAFLGVANNDTTTTEGYVADARVVKTHRTEIDKLSADVSGIKNGISVIGDYYSSVPEADITLATGKSTPVASITLPKGSYIITAYVRFAANGSGYRYANVSSSSGSTAQYVNSSPTGANSPTVLNLSLCVNVNNATSTLYLNVFQSSGGNLACTASGTHLRALRIS